MSCVYFEVLFTLHRLCYRAALESIVLPVPVGILHLFKTVCFFFPYKKKSD